MIRGPFRNQASDVKLPGGNSIPRDYYAVKEIDLRLSRPLIRSTSTFCDVGGASGVDALNLSSLASFGICLDIDKIKLDRGKRMFRLAHSAERVDFVRGSATHLPCKDSIFDLVVCFSVLDHLPNKKSAHHAIEEFARVVATGGHVVITVPNKLFIVGTILMRIKQALQPESYFEQRFAPKEVIGFIASTGLSILHYESMNPAFMGKALIESNLPKVLSRIPQAVFTPLLAIGLRITRIVFSSSLLGARFGCVSQKRRIHPLNAAIRHGP